MEDKKTSLAVILAIVVIIIYTQYVMEPYLAKGKKATTPQTAQSASSSSAPASAPLQVAPGGNASDIAAPPPQAVAQNVAQVLAPNTAPAVRSDAEFRNSPRVVIDTELATITVSSIGGRVLSYKLKQYKKALGALDPVDLVKVGADLNYPFGVWVGPKNDGDLIYTFEGQTPENSPNKELYLEYRGEASFTLPMRATLPDGGVIQKSITVKGNTYLAQLGVNVSGDKASKQPIWIEWLETITSQEAKNLAHERLGTFGVKSLLTENKVDFQLGADLPVGNSALRSVRWISIEDMYFLTALMPSPSTANAQSTKLIAPNGDESLLVRVGNFVGNGSAEIYIGPKSSNVLESVGHDLYRSIDLGIFSFLAFPLLWLLRFFHSGLGNWGLAIIVLTIFVKTVFLPLTKASFKSMSAMQDLQPEMKALRERITDPTQLNQEMLALYRRKGVNPMGGCLPILLQIPVFFGLYNALLHAIELRHAPFAVWIQDLSSPERLQFGAINLPIMVLVLGVSMFVQQYMTPMGNMDRCSARLMLFVPVILVFSFIFYPIPAGLVLYWVVNNTMSIVQQSFIKTDRTVTPFQATLMGGGALFAVGYILTLI